MEAEVRDILKETLDSPNGERVLGTPIHEHFTDIGGVELDLPKRNSAARFVDFSE